MKYYCSRTSRQVKQAIPALFRTLSCHRDNTCRIEPTGSRCAHPVCTNPDRRSCHGDSPQTGSHFQRPGDGRSTLCAEFISNPAAAGVRVKFERGQLAAFELHCGVLKIDADSIRRTGPQFTRGAVTSHGSDRITGCYKPDCTTVTSAVVFLHETNLDVEFK